MVAAAKGFRIVLAGFYPPPAGGESIHLRALSLRLRDAGMLKRIVNLRRAAPQSPDYINGAGPVRTFAVLMRLLSGQTLLHLHTNGHSWKSWTMVACAASALRIRGVPGVLTLHSGMSPGFLADINAVGKRAVRRTLASFAQIVCVNEEIRRALARLGVSSHRITVVPAFLGAKSGTLDDEHERTLAGRRPLVSVVAGAGPEYGLPMLIEALPRLRFHHPGIGCMILGHDGSEGPLDLVRRLDLSETVRFLGQLPHDQCLALIARSDLLVRPSLADGDALSVREALSMGVPVVASNVGSRPPTATLFRTSDTTDLVEKVLGVLRGARSSPTASGDAPDFGDAILAVYDKALSSRKTKTGFVKSARRAVRSLRQETIGFRVDYPLAIVPSAEQPDSLRYHIYSDHLFLENIELDQHGVPLKQYRLLGSQYNPLFVAWWGLHHLERAARERDHSCVNVFLTQLDWLRTNAVTRPDGAVVWPCNFNWQEGRARLEAPWISAMYQGVVISALVRGFRLTKDRTLLELALAGTRVFSVDVRAGGVRTHEAGAILYEEYPAFPLPRILDGFLFALLGLFDLYTQTRDDDVGRLFTDGVDGLTAHLRWWDYRGKWSWYGSHGYLCPPHYHAVNRALLLVLHQLTGQRVFQEVAQHWNADRLSRRDRIEVLIAFAVTKNWARARLRNERGS
jgi:glycogen synthase